MYSGLQYVLVCALPTTWPCSVPSPTKGGSVGTTGSSEPQISKRNSVFVVLFVNE